MKVWKLGDLRITNDKGIVFTKQASWRLVGDSGARAILAHLETSQLGWDR